MSAPHPKYNYYNINQILVVLNPYVLYILAICHVSLMSQVLKKEFCMAVTEMHFRNSDILHMGQTHLHSSRRRACLQTCL